MVNPTLPTAQQQAPLFPPPLCVCVEEEEESYTHQHMCAIGESWGGERKGGRLTPIPPSPAERERETRKHKERSCMEGKKKD